MVLATLNGSAYVSSEQRPYTPLRARHGMDLRDYAPRTKDIEPHLHQPLWGWCSEHLFDDYYQTLSPQLLSVALRMEECSYSALANATDNDPNLLLDMVDCLLRFGEFDDHDDSDIVWLEQMLDAGGSVWQVAPDRKSLIERTLEVELTALQLAAQGDDQIAADINAAWKAAWRRQDPSANEAYTAAVKAIEGVLAPIVTPDDLIPSLGKMISALRDKPEKWDTRFRGVETVEALVAMLDEVWRSQHRHGGGSGVPNTLDEARDAVSITVAVVGLCRRGFLERLDELTPDEEAADRERAAELRRELDANGAENTIPIEELFADLRAGGE